MTFDPSERVRSVPPSGIRRFFELAEEMDDVISRAAHGAEKSGSPTPREMTSSISSASSKNRRMPDGGTDRTRSEGSNVMG